MTLLTNTWEILDMVADHLEAYKGPLGIQYVGKYNEKLLPSYPAVVITPGGREKSLHATNTFNVEASLDLYVYHSKLTSTKRERSKEDLLLIANIEASLDSDFKWTDDEGNPRIIFGYVSSERPGVLQPGVNKSPSIIATRITWQALSQRRFR